MRGTKIERSPGVWRFRVFVGSDPATGKPIQVSRTFKGTKKEADTALAKFVVEVTSGNAPMHGATTVAEFLDRWIDHITPTRSPTTVRGYKFKTKRIVAKLGRVRIDRLTPQQLDQTYRAWLDEGLDPSSVHHLHRILSASLNQAVKWGLIPAAPTARSSPPPRRLNPKQIPSPETIQQLIDAAEKRNQPVLAAAISVAVTTGLRRAELAGLRWDDLDLDKARLHVRRSIKKDLDGHWTPGDTKTHQSRRIALDAFTVEVLREHRKRAEGWATDAGVELSPNGYMITFDPSGVEPMRPDSLGQAFGRLCAAEGVEGMTLHSLRHFSASMLIASGRDVRTIAGRLGHSDPMTTLRVYAHMVDGRDQDAADFLGDLMTATKAAALEKG